MIRPAGFLGAAFGTAAEGDPRREARVRRSMSESLEISPNWAWVSQVHGTRIADVVAPGSGGEADGIATSQTGLPVTVATADCVPIVFEGPGVAAIAHAGWRGTASGVVRAMLDHLAARGTPPSRAAIGPSIGPCCYEVGPEVTDRFPGHTATTDAGLPSVDLASAVADQLGDMEVWRSDECTFHSGRYHSYRRNRTEQRQVAVAWIPATIGR